ncbi:MAG: hypothetical protein VX877_02375, partial [Planctomycetota bacterium]|nr:hypothetical protein [Planctomycetota bacterium]
MWLALVSVCFGGFVVAAWNRERNETSVVALIQERGGSVERVGWFDPRVWHWRGVLEVDLSGTRADARVLGSLRGLVALRRLNLLGASVRDRELVTLNKCRGLRKIRFDRTNITDSGLQHLAGMT